MQISDIMGEWDLEIWDVWRWNAKYKNNITVDRVNELIKVRSCMPKMNF